MPVSTHYQAAPAITELGDTFYAEVKPAQFPRSILRFRNQRWADTIGLGDLTPDEWCAYFAKFDPLPGNLPKPLALRYHGHQFDVYNPQLGDGRGFLYAQLKDDRGRLLDLGTKGSGTTPWSRGADGRLTLKGGVREVLATEMLEALGVNTSKSLSLFETGEKLMRGDEPSPTRSSVLVRLSHSHVRIGSFQRLSYDRDAAGLEQLFAYSVRHYFPHLEQIANLSDRVERFLDEVVQRTASVCAAMMVAGFVHGVLNSDNMTITGECFDYGPYRFLPTYDVEFTAAYFDHGGLYAYGQQPRAMFRNLARLAECLRPLAPHLALAHVLSPFESKLESETTTRLLARLGLASNGMMDGAIAPRVYEFLDASPIGYDQFFFDLHGGLDGNARVAAKHGIYQGERWASLAEVLAVYGPNDEARTSYYDGETPCTLLIDEIETIWSAIAEGDDWAPFDGKIRQIRAMPRLA